MLSDVSWSHRIKRAIFDLQYPDESTAFSVRARLEELLHRELIRGLEDVFDACAPAGTNRRIHRLEVDLGRVDPGRLDADIILRAIRSQLPAYIHQADDPETETRSAASLLEDAMCTFLESGAIPWDSPYPRADALAQEIMKLDAIATSSFVARLTVLLRRRHVRARVARQFSMAFIEWIIHAIFPVAPAALVEAAQMAMASREPEAVWEAVFAIVADVKRDRPRVAARLVEQIHRIIDIASTPSPDQEVLASVGSYADQPDVPPNGTDVQELYVSHAGIVILHPFLAQLFENLRYTDRTGCFVSQDARSRAVHLLHYLAVGAEEPEEDETVLFKCLCGMETRTPLVRRLRLRNEECDEADRLLIETIRHWDKLGNTSPQGLREGFLEREGKLTPRRRGWILSVERRSIDILLDYLPWSLSVVRLPWRDSPLYVDWV